MKQTRDFNPFNRIKIESPEQSLFDLSFDKKMTLDIGKLYPCLIQETLPGDSYRITPELFMRFAPMIFPIMHRLDVVIHFFYVPNRILWNNWEKFLAGENYHPPFFQGGTVGNEFTVETSTLWDYLEQPLTDDLKEKISAFPWLAYARIINEYYQDQNNDSGYLTDRDKLETLAAMNGLISADDIKTGATNYNDPDIGSLFHRAWEHDYFTSALPFAQKGDPVTIPITLGDLPVEVATLEKIIGGGDPNFPFPVTSATDGLMTVDGDAVLIKGTAYGEDALIQGTINELRAAIELQKFLELNARAGTRYSELIRAHFRQNIGDARISRPEYIGGVKNNVVISEVLQTSQTSGDAALGDYAGYGSAMAGGNTIDYHCVEHGFIMGLMSVLPKTAYYQGINRKFSRFNYLDYYWKEFAHIGEQAILNKELYYSELDPDGYNNRNFGYVPRYSEYKYNPSMVHGNFRDSMLDFTMVRKFDTEPSLNEEFIYCFDDKRIFAVTSPDVDSLYCHVWYNIMAKRPIPFFTDPAGL